MIREILLILIPFFINFIFSYKYLRYASNNGPYSLPNYRSLHKRKIAKGGGIGIGISFLLTFFLEASIYQFNFDRLKILVFGGILSLIFGFYDERKDIKAKYQIILNLICAFLILFSVNIFQINFLAETSFIFKLIFSIIVIFFIIWLFNAGNFIDGTDGMASSAASFICLSMGLYLRFNNQNELSNILFILLGANLSFLLFNYPPAKIFMGDSGSRFNSYILVATAVLSIKQEFDMIFYWGLASGYYLIDTSLTTFTRFLTVPKFWLGHRSHAYQNLARIWDDHRKILNLILLINLIWISPLMFILHNNISLKWVILIIAYLPLMLFTYKFGPKFEDK